MASVILGEWTHRRGDAGGARAVSAEIDKPRPTICWSWRPEHGGHVDQVRVVGGNVLVATMMPRDPTAPGWEHAVVYAIDARTGEQVARRVLPDPVPVAAMIAEAGVLHIVATRRGEPVFWYALSAADLAPKHRRVVALTASPDDVLEAWACPVDGLWLQLDARTGLDARRTLAYAFARPEADLPAGSLHEDELHEGGALMRDACTGGDDLFAPVDGEWTREAQVPPALLRLSPAGAKQTAWVNATIVGPRGHIHALSAGDMVCAVAAAQDTERPDRVSVEALAIDRASGDVKWQSRADRIEVRARLGDAARVARRPNGEVLFQSLGSDGAPCSPLLCARPDGKLDVIALGTRGRYVLDAALGDTVLAHRETKDGRVEVGGFTIDHGGLFGRRASLQWSVDAGDLGAASTVYAGAGTVVVRGARAVCALRM